MKYHLITLGCQMNKSDSERVQTVLEKMGFQWTEKEENAHILGILACSVRQKAIDKVYSRIHVWNKRKNQANLLTFVSGCILPADKVKFLKLFDLVFTMDELPEVPEMIRQYGVTTPYSIIGKEDKENETGKTNKSSSQPIPSLLEMLQDEDSPGKNIITSDLGVSSNNVDDRTIMDGFWHIKPHYSSDFEAFVPIQNGCDKFCTYCAVPYTRGREVSRPHREILEEVENLIKQGYKSITLLGQNVNSYGLDKKDDEISFPELLEKIGQFGKKASHKFWIYFTSPHPRDMTHEVIDVISRYDCLAKQIHLPLQSGDDRILEKMNRKHNLEKYREIVHYIRKTLPSATLFTDIIVGFTSETNEQFEKSRKALHEFQFNMAYIAIYSPRPGAVSSHWQDDVPHTIKKERLHILTRDLEESSQRQTQQMVEKTLTVLITGQDRKKRYLTGYTEGRINVRIPSGDLSLLGNFVNVKITSATQFSLEGKLQHIKEPEKV